MLDEYRCWPVRLVDKAGQPVKIEDKFGKAGCFCKGFLSSQDELRLAIGFNSRFSTFE